MNVFELRNQLVADYANYIRSFIRIRDKNIRVRVESWLNAGQLWPDPLIQLNPNFEFAGSVEKLVADNTLHSECARVFRVKKSDGIGKTMRLYMHQAQAILKAREGRNYVLTTGTGSGKSLAYIVPIVDRVLRDGGGRGIQAIVVYPMNALANSQLGELKKFLCEGYPDEKGPVTFARYTGQEDDAERNRIVSNPPDILLTNYVMLELILTRPYENGLVKAAQGLKFLVLDELHTYRGRQGADVALLVRRAREFFGARSLQVVGTSATLAGPGTFAQQRIEVAKVASVLFGAEVTSDDVIGETLQRATSETSFEIPAVRAALKQRCESRIAPPTGYKDFVADPLANWIEGTFGVYRDPEFGRLRRQKPRTLAGAAAHLSEITGVDTESVAIQIAETLLAGYACEPNPETGFPPFAFRLHQFISRGDTVYASLEDEEKRYLTLNRQQYVPGDRTRILLPLVFCRECGQEYYCVRRHEGDDSVSFVARELQDRSGTERAKAGFLYISADRPWPSGTEDEIALAPDDWKEETAKGIQIKRALRKFLPQTVSVATNGLSGGGVSGHFLPSPFRFCLHCRVSYSARTTSDFGKLTSLGTEGRSTATTILSLATVRHLYKEATLAPHARKLLSFTDNRQDASLQAGHFNDFVQIGLLRAALYKACSAAGPAGLTHEVLTQKVFDAVALPFASYSKDPELKFQAKIQTDLAFRNVIGYRLYHDLRRGWRVTSPNLEQCGLLEINYLSLDELCSDEESWRDCHPALVSALPDTRKYVARTLLDFMRRSMAIQVDYLDQIKQETIQQQSNQRLVEPWALDENELMERAWTLYPRSSTESDSGGDVFLTSRGGFGQFLRRTDTLPHYSGSLKTDETNLVIRQLLAVLQTAGLVEIVREPRNPDEVPGYRLPASAVVWSAADGSRPFRDAIRVPGESAATGRTNEFFVNFYSNLATELVGYEAREHTAQVPYEDRLRREDRFRKGLLPVMYCSPTMELGVDITELNVVNMRNVPPTPANYAQRSGRAGRSGQPALVFTYCTTGSPHDQYFFKRPTRMVSGEVTPPRLELANEDLVRAHLQAIWLKESGLDLRRSLSDLLDVTGNAPTLKTLPNVLDDLRRQPPRVSALVRARRILQTFEAELEKADWYTAEWPTEVFNQIERCFDSACERWRGLCRAALDQQRTQNAIIMDMSRSADDRRQAERLRREAESQYKLLTEANNAFQSDFYSYRYFASEGFLPGYNFPRLPLSAYIPARRTSQRDEFLSRPRFLAITEFGPRAIVYHEGSRYLINKVIMPLGPDGPVLGRLKRCERCGYLHAIVNPPGPDLCENCQTTLPAPMDKMLRLQNVSTRRKDKINSDEEERLRLGYETQSGFRYAEYRGVKSHVTAEVTSLGETIASLHYGHAATLWRINLGWRRRKIRDQYGFVLDTERGYWQRSEENLSDAEDDGPDIEGVGRKNERVIPYVEDRRNALILEPRTTASREVITSLAFSLKNALQVMYQLEDDELACELLPNWDEPNSILLYEAAEGGAGVLRRLLNDKTALPRLAAEALSICHFDPESGEDRRRAPSSNEDCEAACYDCLLSYSNQLQHPVIDRKAIRDLLLEIRDSSVVISATAKPRPAHLAELKRLCASRLEESWLDLLEAQDCRLPSSAQSYIEAAKTRPDFLYGEYNVVVYIDGPPHDFPERQARDRTQHDLLEDLGYQVIRFGHNDDWGAILKSKPGIFGSTK